jgi:iron complex outermembrane recepter protein
MSINYLVQPNFSLYAQYAKGFLIPQLSDSLEAIIPLANGGVGCTTAKAATAASPASCNLQPTKTVNYQAGLVYAGDRLNIDADAYYITATNSTSVDPGTGIAAQTNESTTYEGVEAQASYVILKGLTALANGSLNSAKGDVSHLWVSQAPNYTAALGLIYNTPTIKFSFLHKFTDSATVKYDNNGLPLAPSGGQTVRIQPYSTGTASASYTFRNFSLGLVVYNVFNDRSTTKIGSSTGANPLYFFQPGRSYQGTLKVKF